MAGLALTILQAATASAANEARPACQAYEIPLHGSNPATGNCITTPASPDDPAARAISAHGRGTDQNDVVIYWNEPIDVSRHVIPPPPGGFTRRRPSPCSAIR